MVDKCLSWEPVIYSGNIPEYNDLFGGGGVEKELVGEEGKNQLTHQILIKERV